MQLRGGGDAEVSGSVLHLEALEQVDALIEQASANGELLVLNFTASWKVGVLCVLRVALCRLSAHWILHSSFSLHS